MPEARALRTFKGRYGVIRAGTVFHADPGYLAQLQRNKLAEPCDTQQRQPGPSKDRSIPSAPEKKRGNEEPGKGKKDPGTAQTEGNGRGITSASLPVGRASTKKTSTTSAAGARKGTPTPRKKKTSSTPAAE